MEVGPVVKLGLKKLIITVVDLALVLSVQVNLLKAVCENLLDFNLAFLSQLLAVEFLYLKSPLSIMSSQL
jgi:hypothetical protein